MKKINIAISALALALMAQPLTASATEPEGRITQGERMQMQKASEPEIVRWVGTFKDKDGSHTTEHEHELEFTRKDSGDSYDIVDSPELVKLHHETQKNYVVEIEAEKTPKFLFWGGSLIIKNFKVVEDASGPIKHQAPAAEPSSGKPKFIGRHGL